MISEIIGYLYVLVGVITLVVGILLPNNIVSKIIIRSQKVENENQYIKRHRLICIPVSMLTFIMGYMILTTGFKYFGVFNIVLLLVIYIGDYFRNKIL